MKKLKLNEQTANKFFEGCFGGIYTREMIDSFLKAMNKSNADNMELASSFYDKETMDCEDNDVEIIVSIKLRKITD